MHAIAQAVRQVHITGLLDTKTQCRRAIEINDHARTLDIQQYQQRIAWVAQSPTLFSGSIAENVALAQPDAPLGAIRGCKDVALMITL